jgi:hypothetical protein
LRFDVGSELVLPDPREHREGCSKADFLFVIDNSNSMGDEQQHLIESFPGFIQAIEDQTAIIDYQILVVDTDGFAASEPLSPVGQYSCADWCPCVPYQSCSGASCMPPGAESCDVDPGAGKTRNEALIDCGFARPGQRYMTSSQADLPNTFACVARVGISGCGHERPMHAMVQAVGPLSASGQCNQGFLRDDAILVVTVITDEAEDGSYGGDLNSPGDPTSWKQALVQAKGGDERAAVVLALVGDSDLPSPVCTQKDPSSATGVAGAEPAPSLREFADSFEFGNWSSVCAASYVPFFETAIGVIEDACDVFIPPG